MNNETPLVRVYKCKHCKIRIVNHSVLQINEHRKTHGQGEVVIPEKPSPRELNWIKRKKKKIEKKKKPSLKLKQAKPIQSGFSSSREWRVLRYRALKVYGRKCHACGRTDGPLHVDHIKPRSNYPELALEFSNLQILCEDCNLGKSNWDETDWRPHAQVKGKL